MSLDGTDFGEESMNLLEGRNLAEEFEQAKGITVDDIDATEDVTLVTILVDDSSSMDSGSDSLLKTSINDFISDLKNAERSESIMIGAFSLNGSMKIPYRILESFPEINNSNYCPNGMTPLYDNIAKTLANVGMKVAEFENTGITVNAVTMIMTDGWDNDSREIRHPSELKPMIKDLLQSEKHIISAMGFGESKNGVNDFKKIFSDMGILEKWSFVSSDLARDIRRAFNLMSKSVSNASQSAAAFSQEAQAGGFAG